MHTRKLSTDTGIATVKNGVVTGKKAGKVEITATVGATTRTCTVTVKAPVLKSSDTSELIDSHD